MCRLITIILLIEYFVEIIGYLHDLHENQRFKVNATSAIFCNVLHTRRIDPALSQ